MKVFTLNLEAKDIQNTNCPDDTDPRDLNFACFSCNSSRKQRSRKYFRSDNANRRSPRLVGNYKRSNNVSRIPQRSALVVQSTGLRGLPLTHSNSQPCDYPKPNAFIQLYPADQCTVKQSQERLS